MAPNSFIIPDFSDIFEELPSKQQTVLPSTMPQAEMHGPIIVRPLPDIQTFIDTFFQYTIPTTSYYIVLSNGGDTSRLVFTASFFPTNAEKWVKFDDKLRKLSGTPPNDSAPNTTVHLHILDPGYGSTNTTMHILVSNCEGEMCINYMPPKILAVITVLSVLFGICVLSVFGFILFKKWKKRTKKITLRKQPNFLSVTPKHRGQNNDGIVEMSQSYPFNEPNDSRLYRSDRCDVCDRILPHEELDQAHYNKSALFSDSAMDQFPLKDSNSGTYNFKNVAFSDSLGLGISLPGTSNLNDSELQTPNQIDIGSYTPAVPPLKFIKRTTSSIYSASSATASCDNITQTVSSTGLKKELNVKLTKSDIPIFYAKLGVLFQYSVKNLINSSAHHKRRLFIKAVTEPNNSLLPEWLNFNTADANLWGIPYKNDIGKTIIKVLQRIYDISSQEENKGIICNNNLGYNSHEVDSIESSFQVVEKFMLVVVENDIDI
ncbi:21121_t:CDS:1 [Dentiscutata erythropus]|uniref:21121_t:CDS:1 n=1 Tax=Dentiscutata erythropus TaxID=1348616 RepID=A0A9N9HDS8_9GLOM|nr:21121_t:CDS:1 [Dentiscutata erythropus]